jgi:hypothetical protein
MADDDTPLKDSAALLWAEVQRQMTRQEASLDGLRNRAVAMLSVASIVAALFGGHIEAGDHSTRVVTASIFALTFFGVGALLSLLILAPKTRGWAFAEKLSGYFTRLQNQTLTPVSVTSNLAENFEASRKENEAKLERLYAIFKWVCILVSLQVIAWGIAAV